MLCLLSAGVVVATLAADAFTLRWLHSVEKIVWEEDWRVAADGRLVADTARLQGSGAGMEPPDGARLIDGWWHYRPALAPQPRLALSRSRFTTDYTLCWGGGCRPLGDLVPLGDQPSVTVIEPCPPLR